MPLEPKGSEHLLLLGSRAFLIMNKSKKQIRQRIRLARKHLSPEQQLMAAEKVCSFVTHLTRYRLGQHIAFYLSFEGELDPKPLLLHAHQSGKHCYLPVLHPRQIGTLAFVPYTPGDPLIANRFGILEPAIKNETNYYPIWHLDIVFTPLVAFDHQQNRLGMGKVIMIEHLHF